MPANTTETVVEHSAGLQPSINLHAPAFIFHCSGTNVLPRRDEGSGKPCAVIEALQYIGLHSGFEIISGDHYTTTAHVWRLKFKVKDEDLETKKED